MPQSTAIFWPMIAHVMLVFGVYRLLLARRLQAVKAGHAQIGQFRENRNEPPESLIVRNNLGSGLINFSEMVGGHFGECEERRRRKCEHFQALCDKAIAERHPIPSGQDNGINLQRQTAQPGFSPLAALFLVYFRHYACHFAKINVS